MQSEKEEADLAQDQFQRLSEFFIPTLEGLAPGKRITNNLVADAWVKVMGAQASSHIKVIGFFGKKLRLSTAELNWYRTIQKNKDSIIDRLNAHLESRVIVEVEVVFTG